MKNESINNLKVNPKFRNFKKRGTCFVLAGLMTASLCGQARAMEQTPSEGQTISLMSTTPSKLYNVSRVAKFGANVNINDKSAMPVDANGNEVFPFFDNATETNYFPIRALAIFLNVDIRWDDATQTVVVDTSKGANLTDNAPYRTPTKLTAGTFIGQGGIKVTIDGVPFIPTNQKGQVLDIYISDKWTVYAPGRALCEALGVPVDYDNGPNHNQMNIYLGKHIAIEDPNALYGLPGDPNYKVPSENDSQEELAARYISLYDQWSKNRALIKTTDKEMGQLVEDTLYQYNEYKDSLAEGNVNAQVYIDKIKAIANELDEIGKKLEENFTPNFNSVYSNCTNYYTILKTNTKGIEKAYIINGICNMGEYVKSTSNELDLFTPDIEQQYRNRFQALYDQFKTGITLNSYDAEDKNNKKLTLEYQ